MITDEELTVIETVLNSTYNITDMKVVVVINSLIARLRSAEDALKFYADKDNWIAGDYKTFSAIREKNFPVGDADSNFFGSYGYRGGKRARAHFNNIK